MDQSAYLDVGSGLYRVTHTDRITAEFKGRRPGSLLIVIQGIGVGRWVLGGGEWYLSSACTYRKCAGDRDIAGNMEGG